MNITVAQKRLFVMLALIIAAVLVFVLFIYLPAQRKLERLRGELQAIDRDERQLRECAGGAKTSEEIISRLNQKLAVLSQRFPEKDETVLRELSSFASRGGVEIISVRPERKRVVEDLSAEVGISGSVVQEMPIVITLNASYRALGDFLRALKSDLSVYLCIDDIEITKDKENVLLSVTLKVRAYLVCPQNEEAAR